MPLAAPRGYLGKSFWELLRLDFVSADWGLLNLVIKCHPQKNWSVCSWNDGTGTHLWVWRAKLATVTVWTFPHLFKEENLAFPVFAWYFLLRLIVALVQWNRHWSINIKHIPLLVGEEYVYNHTQEGELIIYARFTKFAFCCSLLRS